LGGATVVMIGTLIEQHCLSARNWPFGAALGMMVMAAVLVLLLYYIRIVTREERRSGGSKVAEEVAA
ncbi:MAG: ABC transporter permease, partial [Pseudomonadota bacterium]|nr:ABC transporter permease [Pseudomonadota bacterium]